MKKATIDYSPMENKLLSILKGGKELTISQLAKFVYGDSAPYHAHNSLRMTIARLGAKMAYNREKLSIWKSERRGHREITYWME